MKTASIFVAGRSRSFGSEGYDVIPLCRRDVGRGFRAALSRNRPIVSTEPRKSHILEGDFRLQNQPLLEAIWSDMFLSHDETGELLGALEGTIAYLSGTVLHFYTCRVCLVLANWHRASKVFEELTHQAHAVRRSWDDGTRFRASGESQWYDGPEGEKGCCCSA